ncbi:branched-chain amino acid ABC transporter permease [Nocardioides immobilis]|uniref:Branched-chain amino acid ABC transporter permease n=1 Tax=Nocardioides immobilis TaxID=2049295 RepID=A0A417XTI6_9ACTN|nr:branched-chain amino acid ABC transporter permease [Nocardioides immobilis]RHW23663.1 branched-chain amino acid ABC transporter permease [Nocardioides immobilis]
MSLFLSMLLAGVLVGAIYGLVAVGYTVVFSATGVFNLAQGHLVMVAIMGTFYLTQIQGMSLWVAWPAVIAGVVALSLVEERTVVRPFLRRPGSFGWFISTLAFSLVVEAIVLALYGDHPLTAIPSPFSANGIDLGPVTIVPRRIAILVALVVVVIALEQFYRRARWGNAMRASADDREAAALRGINPNRISQLAFILGGLVAAITGLLIGPLTYSDPTVGLAYTLKGFIALAIGGFGSFRGAIVGGLAVGVAEQAINLYGDPAYELLGGLLVLLIVLSVRPEGVFGTKSLRMV